MKPVRLPSTQLDEILRHALATYPEECCGFLVAGPSSGSTDLARQIRRVEPVDNRFDGERSRRFAIRSEDLLALERKLEPTGELVVGFYHSHPDHPARPSAYDREHAWPWYTYLVVSVVKGKAGPAGAFELDEESQEFRPAPLEIIAATGKSSEAGASERVSTGEVGRE